MVRLRQRFGVTPQKFQLPGFNPTMVRLRLQAVARLIEFAPMFQSHYGAIATTTSKSDMAHERACFNPTMVRLRPCNAVFPRFFLVCFNPTMVRLRLLPMPGPPHKSVGGFNPTMVRLRRELVGSACSNYRSFQSHYGAIATW